MPTDDDSSDVAAASAAIPKLDQTVRFQATRVAYKEVSQDVLFI